MNKKLTATCALLGLLAAPAIASAATTAHTNAAVNLRTGPDAGYPRVTTLPAGTALQVYGCINDWSWCDVGVGRERGWISAGLIDYVENNRRLAISLNGQRLGLQVLGFTLDTYWDTHYRNRSWYGQRQQWANYQPASRTAAPAARQATAKPAQAATAPKSAATPSRQAVAQPSASKPASAQPQASRNGANANQAKKEDGKARQDAPANPSRGHAEEKRPR